MLQRLVDVLAKRAWPRGDADDTASPMRQWQSRGSPRQRRLVGAEAVPAGLDRRSNRLAEQVACDTAEAIRRADHHVDRALAAEGRILTTKPRISSISDRQKQMRRLIALGDEGETLVLRISRAVAKERAPLIGREAPRPCDAVENPQFRRCHVLMVSHVTCSDRR